MQLIDIFYLVQVEIMEQMLELAINEGDEDELNELIIAIIHKYKLGIQNALRLTRDKAIHLIDQFTLDQWGVVADHEDNLKQSADYLNDFIIMALIGRPNQPSKAMQMYVEVIGLSKGTEDYKSALKHNFGDRLTNGFQSNFKDNYVWSIDRYVNQIEKHIYTDIYNHAQTQVVEQTNTELVWVDSFPKPRQACTELQTSGWICVVPRNLASDESQAYPNIWDPGHAYLEPHGHHGINCRHVWHNKKGLQANLYYAIDVATTKMYQYRKAFKDVFY